MSDPLGFLSPQALGAIEDLVDRRVDERLRAQAVDRPGRWMTPAEAAEYARVTRQTIYDWRSCGLLSRHGGHGHALVDRNELDALLDNSGRSR